MHLYDEGLVYDLMEEVVAKGYSFSVLDCNSFVKTIQRSPGKLVCHEDVSSSIRRVSERCKSATSSTICCSRALRATDSRRTVSVIPAVTRASVA